jgi:flagellar hook-length control protein FliK
MNATSPISQAPRNPDPTQAASPQAADQAASSNGQDFAGALSDAGGRTARRHQAIKQHNSAPRGSALPASGNPQPLSLPPPPARTNSPTAQAGNSASAISSPAAGTAPNSAPAQAPATAAAAAGDPSNGAQPANGAQQPGAQTSSPPVAGTAAESAAAAPAAATVDAASRVTTPAAATVPGAGLTMPHAPSARSFAMTAPTVDAAPADPSAGTTPAKTAVPPPPAVVSNTDAKPNEGPASKADIAAATSAPTSTNVNAQNAPTTANAPSTADADAAAQAIMAAAIAQGTSAPSPDSSAASDDLATPDTGVTLQGVVAANDSPAPLPSGATAVHATAPTSASVIAASAASIVQAVTASADSGATDKHLHSSNSDGSIGAAQLLTSNAASDASPGPAPTFKVGAGVETAEFGQGVADRVSLMMDGNLTTAKLQVNPPALGPIEVRIALQGGHAQISLSSHSAVTRDALEATSPKLREMLGSQGFSQVSVDISHRSFQDSSRQAQPYERLSAIGADSPAVAQTSAAAARSASGLLDAYA